MAHQTFSDFPAPSSVGTSSLFWNRNIAFSVLGGLVESTAYFRTLGLERTSEGGTQVARIQVRLAATEAGDGDPAGPDLTSQAEGNWQIRIVYGDSHWDFDHADFDSDIADPYLWTSSDADAVAALGAAISAIGNNSGIAVTFWDGAGTNPFNTAPTADAGDDQTVDGGDSVSLDGSGSTDPDGTIASYAWAQQSGTTVTLADDDTSTPDFTAPAATLADQDLVFRLTVTDNDGATDTDDVTVTVRANMAPTANAGDDQTVEGAAEVTLDGSGSSDPDGTIASYAWAQQSGTTVSLLDEGTSTPDFAAPPATAVDQVLVFRLTVTDDDGATDTDDVTVTVRADTQPTAPDLGTIELERGGSVVLDPGTGGNDPLTHSVTTSLPRGVTFDAATRTLAATADAVLGTTAQTYRVEDADGDDATDDFSLLVFANVVETTIVFDSLAAFTALFPDAETDTADGHWKAVASGRSGSHSTGPTPNNALAYVTTEASPTGGSPQNSIPESEMEDNGTAVMAASAIPSGVGRTLRIRAVIGGSWQDAEEGLRIEWTDGGGGNLAALLRGWRWLSSETVTIDGTTYSNPQWSSNSNQGDTLVDVDDELRSVVANGGWVDFEVDIPDAATGIRIRPRIVYENGVDQNDDYRHDISIREMQWSYQLREQPMHSSDVAASGAEVGTGSPQSGGTSIHRSDVAASGTEVATGSPTPGGTRAHRTNVAVSGAQVGSPAPGGLRGALSDVAASGADVDTGSPAPGGATIHRSNVAASGAQVATGSPQPGGTSIHRSEVAASGVHVGTAGHVAPSGTTVHTPDVAASAAQVDTGAVGARVDIGVPASALEVATGDVEGRASHAARVDSSRAVAQSGAVEGVSLSGVAASRAEVGTGSPVDGRVMHASPLASSGVSVATATVAPEGTTIHSSDVPVSAVEASTGDVESKRTRIHLRQFRAEGAIHMAVRLTTGTFTRGNGQVNLWASTGWTDDGAAGQVGAVAEGDADVAGIPGNAPTVVRLAKWDRAGDDDRLSISTTGGNIGDLFDDAADPYMLTLVAETETGDGYAMFTLSPEAAAFGAGFVNWQRDESPGHLEDDDWNVFDAIQPGQDVILAVHQGRAFFGALDFESDVAASGAEVATGEPATAGTVVHRPNVAVSGAEAATGGVSARAELSPPVAASALEAGAGDVSGRVSTATGMAASGVEVGSGQVAPGTSRKTADVASSGVRAASLPLAAQADYEVGVDASGVRVASGIAAPGGTSIHVSGVDVSGVEIATGAVTFRPPMRHVGFVGSSGVGVSGHDGVHHIVLASLERILAEPPPEPPKLSATPDLLIDQWRSPRAPRLNAILRIFLDAVQRHGLDATARLALMRSLDYAEGVWLDRIGERLGIPRPSVVDQGDVFGFDDAGSGFDMARLRDLGPVQPRTPVGDELYRKLIRARGWTVIATGSLDYMERAVSEVDPNAIVTDLDDMSFRVTTALRAEIELADRSKALPRPAGVRMQVADVGLFGYDDAGTGFDQGRLNNA